VVHRVISFHSSPLRIGPEVGIGPLGAPKGFPVGRRHRSASVMAARGEHGGAKDRLVAKMELRRVFGAKRQSREAVFCCTD
jgi:hypothetical protein